VLEQTTELPVAENANGPVEPAAYEPEGTAPAA